MSAYVWIGLGGFIGALARYGVSGWIANMSASVFPWGTFAVNVSGSFLLGFVTTLGMEAGIIRDPLRTALATGFIGSFTTFSTWNLETFRLIETRSFNHALFNVTGSVATGLLGVWLGVICAKALVR